ncbi:MAG: PadR family transcriptional regulator [Anaerolineales bacterium]|nr:PadR family transcriptional regulator [Anaerolineales bacterium]
MSPLRQQPLTIEYALLGFLLERPSYGYDIHQRLNDPAGLGHVWQIKQSKLYALLTKLEEKGYIAAEFEAQDGRPPRKILQLTEAGAQIFAEWVQTPVTHGRQLRLEFLAKLYFARMTAVATELVARQRAACQTWLQEQQTHAHELGAQRPYEALVVQFRISQIEGMLRWLDVCEQQMSNE